MIQQKQYVFKIKLKTKRKPIVYYMPDEKLFTDLWAELNTKEVVYIKLGPLLFNKYDFEHATCEEKVIKKRLF